VRSVLRYTLGIAIGVHVGVAVRPAAGQTASPHACSLINAAELQRITGRKDFAGLSPRPSKPSELPAHMSECDFLDMSFTLTNTMTPEWFARNRDQSQTKPDRWKVQSISGLGDEGYYLWDPRPGDNRSVGIVFRSGSKQVAIGDLVPADSIEVVKSQLLSIAKLTVPRLK
jgi:hypothetical protein